MKCRIPLFGIIVLIIGICLCISPVAGKYIDSGYTQSFDAASLTNPPFGEEIAVKFWIAAVDNDIQDISVAFKESEAYIDESSFSYTFDSPNQQNVPLDIRTTGKNTWSIAKIKRGEKVTLTFNAYPKTIRKEKLAIGTASIVYTPILDNNQKANPISEDLIQLNAGLADSAWFKYDALQKKYDAEQKSKADIPIWNYTLTGIAAVAIIIAIILFICLLRTKSQLNKEILQAKTGWKSDLLLIRDKLREADESNIPNIRTTVEELLISDRMLVIETSEKTHDTQESGKRTEKKGNTGGF